MNDGSLLLQAGKIQVHHTHAVCCSGQDYLNFQEAAQMAVCLGCCGLDQSAELQTVACGIAGDAPWST